MTGQKYKRSKAYSCVYYTWVNGRLAVMLSWVDVILALGHPEDVSQMKTDLSNVFQCKDEGELKDYVGRKIDIKMLKSGLATVKFT